MLTDNKMCPRLGPWRPSSSAARSVRASASPGSRTVEEADLRSAGARPARPRVARSVPPLRLRPRERARARGNRSPSARSHLLPGRPPSPGMDSRMRSSRRPTWPCDVARARPPPPHLCVGTSISPKPSSWVVSWSNSTQGSRSGSTLPSEASSTRFVCVAAKGATSSTKRCDAGSVVDIHTRLFRRKGMFCPSPFACLASALHVLSARAMRSPCAHLNDPSSIV